MGEGLSWEEPIGSCLVTGTRERELYKLSHMVGMSRVWENMRQLCLWGQEIKLERESMAVHVP